MWHSYNENSLFDNALYFITVAVAVFTVTFGVLYFFDLIPASLRSTDTLIAEDEDTKDSEPLTTSYPDYISIPSIGVESAVGKPQTQDIATLDAYLSRGAVYYPGSGSIEQGNMFIFGHSADIYQGVQNAALKVFNGFSKLKTGDSIVVTADGVRYVYKVTSVKNVTEDDALVTFDTSKRKLTLSTCNTFGQKQDRIVVEADFSHIL